MADIKSRKELLSSRMEQLNKLKETCDKDVAAMSAFIAVFKHTMDMSLSESQDIVRDIVNSNPDLLPGRNSWEAPFGNISLTVTFDNDFMVGVEGKDFNSETLNDRKAFAEFIKKTGIKKENMHRTIEDFGNAISEQILDKVEKQVNEKIESLEKADQPYLDLFNTFGDISPSAANGGEKSGDKKK